MSSDDCSTACLAIAKAVGFRAFALTFQYQQRHHVEIEAARRVAAALRAEAHLVLDLLLGVIGVSALTAALDVPKDRPLEEMTSHVRGRPATRSFFRSRWRGRRS